MKYLLSLFVLLALVIGLYHNAQANDRPIDTWTVCASGCDFSTITSAVADVQVNSGETLDLAGETFAEHDILLDKDLTLLGMGQEMTTIDAKSMGRVLSITQGTTVAIHDLTITGGSIVDSGLGAYGGGTMKISFSTIAQNNGYGIVLADTLLLENSIIADNAMGDCNQILPVNITSLGGNLSSDNSCALTHPSDLPNIDPGLAILGDYGGDTMTHALLTTSPALDAGVNCETVTEDQRGFPRPVGAACDIGAFEGAIPFSNYAYMPIARK